MEKRLGCAGQRKIYIGKCFRMFVNEKQWKSFLSALIIVLLISLVTGDDMFEAYKATNSGCFAVICACIWIGLFNSIQSICRERSIIKREHRTGLIIRAYISAHAVYEFVISAGEALIVCAVVLLKNSSHLPDSGLVLSLIPDFYLSLLLTIFAADTMAMLVSCIVRNETAAMTVMPFVLIIQLVMSGTIFELEGASAIIADLTASRWGMACLMCLSRTDSVVDFESGLANILYGSDPTAGALLLNWLRLVVFSFVFLALSVLALSQVDKDKR